MKDINSINFLRKKILLFSILTAGCICFSLNANASEKRLVKVGSYDFKPIISASHNEVGKGLFGVILKEIADQEDWVLEYHCMPYEDCISELENGNLDLVLGAPFHSKEISGDDVLYFSQETVISTWAQVFKNEGSDLQKIPDLNNMSVGVVADSPYNREFRKLIKQFNINSTVIEFRNNNEIFKAVSKKWIDAGVCDRLTGSLSNGKHHLQDTPIIFSPVELRFVSDISHGNRRLINTIDYHLKKMKEDQNSIYHMTLKNILNGQKQGQFIKAMKITIIIGLILLSIFGIISLLLDLQIKKKNNELQEKNLEYKKEIRMRGEAETALNKSLKLFDKTFCSIRDGILVTSGANCDRIKKCNPGGAELLGYKEEEIVNLSFSRFFAEPQTAGNFSPELKYEIKENGFLCKEYTLRKRGGKLFPAEISITPLDTDNPLKKTWVMIIRDISERKEALEALHESERRLRQAQKMEAIGTLAGGIAHDFNNTLTPIICYTEMLKREVPGAGMADELLSCILKAGNRAKALVKQILEFSRQNEQEHIKIKLSSAVKEVLKLLRAGLPSTIETELKIDLKDDTIFADPTQIHQLLMNICTNAAHAMKGKTGVLEIELSEFKAACINNLYEIIPLKDKTKDYIQLSIKDTGTGISQDTIQRIFDPFFTTKGPGEGTGMGLAVVHGIIQSYEGGLYLETRQGKGTSFHILLPVNKKLEEEAELSCLCSEEIQPKNILFVDDEPMITEMAERLLSIQGHKVTTHTSSLKALEEIEKRPEDFDLVITDQTMPVMTGLELAKSILKKKCNMPIILISGYSDMVTPEKAKANGIKEFLLKPFDKDGINNSIRTALCNNTIGFENPKGDSSKAA